jgi:type II secretory pathway component PulM
MRYLRNLMERLGAAGVLGLGVLLFCLQFYFTALAPAERELRAQRSAIERMKARPPNQAVSIDSQIEKVRHFQALFPPVEELADVVERLHAIAREAKLEPQKTEYRLEPQSTGLVAYRVALPIRGAYPQIRTFIDAVLRDMPIASLDALRFERKRAVDSQLEAQIRLTLHFRPQSNTSAP